MGHVSCVHVDTPFRVERAPAAGANRGVTCAVATSQSFSVGGEVRPEFGPVRGPLVDLWWTSAFGGPVVDQRLW